MFGATARTAARRHTGTNKTSSRPVPVATGAAPAAVGASATVVTSAAIIQSPRTFLTCPENMAEDLALWAAVAVPTAKGLAPLSIPAAELTWPRFTDFVLETLKQPLS